MLAGLGKGHDKFLRQLIMWMDVKAPLYWWKHFDASADQYSGYGHTRLPKSKFNPASY